MNVSAAKIYFVNNDALFGGILTYREVPTYSFESMVGNVGGTLGIWVGVGIFTFIKIFAFCSRACIKKGKKSIRSIRMKATSIHRNRRQDGSQKNCNV